MSSPSNIVELTQRVHPPATRIAAPLTFLSLAPTTSASYPVPKPRTTPVPTAIAKSVLIEESASTEPPAKKTVTEVLTAEEINASLALKHRRTSSMTSQGSGSVRFLRLGPIHDGDDHSNDWSEEVLV
jgi:hypothetical protein